MSDLPFVIRALQREDRDWVAHTFDEHWGSTQMVTRGKLHYGHLLPGFVAERPHTQEVQDEIEHDHDATENNPVVHMQRLGLLTYNVDGKECEIVSLDSFERGIGVGTALVDHLLEIARQSNIKRVWLITTNDNLEALRFWQRRRFTLVALYRNAIEQSRRLKPQISILGQHGIPIRDEIELEYQF